jgi:ornithine cyclodeaminase
MTHTFNLDQIKKVLKNIDVTQAVEQGFIAYSEGKVVVPLVGEMIFEDPPGN